MNDHRTRDCLELLYAAGRIKSVESADLYGALLDEGESSKECLERVLRQLNYHLHKNDSMPPPPSPAQPAKEANDAIK